MMSVKTNKTAQDERLFAKVKAALFGVAVGDALGVPVEFMSREKISSNPVTDRTGFGTYNLPPGTWSDDSSLTFCLAEALTQDFDLKIIAENFRKWNFESFWTARGNVFDIGIGTQIAIRKIAEGENPEFAGGLNDTDNGNGSLMRILPLLFYVREKTIAERFELIRKVSSITHGHIRAVISCFYYIEFAKYILEGRDKFEIYSTLQKEIPDFLAEISTDKKQTAVFGRLLTEDIFTLPENQIESSGYVLHTLEASIWCLMTTQSYREAVLKAVNLGSDTDTTAAVTGGLAGLLYGCENIPENWISSLARSADIEDLAFRLSEKMANDQS